MLQHRANETELREAEGDAARARTLGCDDISSVFSINSTNDDRRVIGLALIATRGNKLITTPRETREAMTLVLPGVVWRAIRNSRDNNITKS